MQINAGPNTVRLHLVNLTFFGLEICCTYSIAGLRICSFFDIKIFIGGRPLFCIFKPIESSSAQNNPLAAALYSICCVCVWMCSYCSSVPKWLWLGKHFKPYGKRPLTSTRAQRDECQSCQDTRFSTWHRPDTKQVNRCRTLGLLMLWMAGGTWVWDGEGRIISISTQRYL